MMLLDAVSGGRWTVLSALRALASEYPATSAYISQFSIYNHLAGRCSCLPNTDAEAKRIHAA